MNIQQITNSQNFKGKLVIVNNLSNKPANCIKKVRGDLESFVRQKDYNLYIKQDYADNEIDFSAKYPFPLKPSQKIYSFVDKKIRVPITSTASKYIDAANQAIDLFEDNIYKTKEFQYEQEQKQRQKQDVVDFIMGIFIGLPVALICCAANEISPKFGKKVENYTNKLFDIV